MLGEAGDFLLWIIWRVHPSLGRKGEAAIPPLTASRCCEPPRQFLGGDGGSGAGDGISAPGGAGKGMLRG